MKESEPWPDDHPLSVNFLTELEKLLSFKLPKDPYEMVLTNEQREYITNMENLLKIPHEIVNSEVIVDAAESILDLLSEHIGLIKSNVLLSVAVNSDEYASLKNLGVEFAYTAPDHPTHQVIIPAMILYKEGVDYSKMSAVHYFGLIANFSDKIVLGTVRIKSLFSTTMKFLTKLHKEGITLDQIFRMEKMEIDKKLRELVQDILGFKFVIIDEAISDEAINGDDKDKYAKNLMQQIEATLNSENISFKEDHLTNQGRGSQASPFFRIQVNVDECPFPVEIIVQSMTNYLKDQHDEKRSHAAYSLRRINPEVIYEILKPFLPDLTPEQVKQQIGEALDNNPHHITLREDYVVGIS